jgi:sugar phosphate isomerase/epimerase
MFPLSLQLWTLNQLTDKDFAGTVADVARLGFKAVELAGTGNLKPKEAAQALKDAGLKVSGAHIGFEMITDRFDELVGNCAMWDTREVIVPGIDRKNFATRESCLALGKKFGEAGAKPRAAGLRFSYHNHDAEFALIDGIPAMEWMLAGAPPHDVSGQVDLYWAYHAGYDPLKAVARLGARARLLHLKDGNKNGETGLGKGAVDFPAIFDFTEKYQLTDWYIIEQETFDKPRLDCLKESLDYLRSLGRF